MGDRTKRLLTPEERESPALAPPVNAELLLDIFGTSTGGKFEKGF